MSSTTTFQCTAGSDIDRLLLQIVAQLNGLSNPLLKVEPGASTSLICTTAHPFCQAKTVQQTAVGLMGSLKLMSSTGILLGESDLQQQQVASWMDSAEQSILTVLRQDNKSSSAAAPILQQASKDFCNQVDAYLFQNDQTVLVGDWPTLADVVVAVAMAATAAATSGQAAVVLPQQAYRHAQTTLHGLMQAVVVNDDSTTQLVATSLKEYSSKLQEGPASPLEKKKTPKTPATKEDKPAPGVASATTTTTKTEEASSSSSENAILQKLDELQLEYDVYEHTLCKTADELTSNVPIPESDSHTKNLFLRDKKHGHFLVTVKPSAVVNTKELGKQLGLKGKTNLRLADEKILDSKLHVKPGCVGLLAMALADTAVDEKEKITLVLDQALLQVDKIHSHPLRNDMSVKMKPQVLQDFLAKIGVEPVILDFGGGSTSASRPPEEEDAAALLPGKVPANRPPATKQPKPAQPKAGGGAQQQPQQKKTAKKGETLLALQWKKDENFAMWYSDVIVLSEMISYYDISGCYVLRPWSYKMWELIQAQLNVGIEKMGVENAYFPLFVSKNRLEREKDHVEGFAPEVAWVTKSGEDDLAEQIAIRPTSETIMYPAYSDWIKSHRDLPLKLNQWSNVVRWEFKYPTPFLRTREFLWQEGHTAHATFEDADETVMQALELYRGVYEDLLAVPVVKGYKTEKEKFAGGYRTTTVEAYVAGSGRAIQGATSHNLGQNFGKMFDIRYQDEKGESQIVWQTSWGLTTRTIGVMVMVHGDDQGLVLPPHVAPIQVVIVPIVSKKLTADEAAPHCKAILADLKAAGIRAKLDDRTMYNPGWKYNHWEQKGVPIRVEVGPLDIQKKSARIVVRHDRSKEDLPVEGLGERLKDKLEEIQKAMFTKAKAARDSHIVKVTEWKDFVPNLEKNNLVLTPWCGGEHQDWEEWVKTTSREESLKARGEEGEDEKTATSVAAKTLCIPFDQPELPQGTKCIASGMDATCWVLWGRSY